MHALPPGPLLIAFSGGPDSLGIAARLRDRAPLLAYVDHRMRGPRESRRERERVTALARALGLPLVRVRVRVRGAEAAARRERFRALAALAGKHGAAAVATAHTADDRAETILLNLLRGTGLRGLASLRPSATIDGCLRVRPALDERRDALRGPAWALEPVLDPTNRRTAGARARARHLLLPALAAALGEDPVPILCALGDLAAHVRETLAARARRIAPGADRRRLLAEPRATFPYLVEALRPLGPPLTASGYTGLKKFLRAGRRTEHRTPGGEIWGLDGDILSVQGEGVPGAGA
ncbi:MAG TPA: tRNA lysidine(34) synthetase TilS [Planctomycetota bacterium]|nr:tRNA lysidine(34) synthetase TilS [Planctomycetota bacterium]